MPKPEKYRPSNGVEGDAFMTRQCGPCVKDSEESPCHIIACTMGYEVDDDEYPTEWQTGPEGPHCTAFEAKSWSIGNDMGTTEYPKEGDTWQMYQGDFFTVLGVGIHMLTKQEMIALTGKHRSVWVLPLEDFLSDVTVGRPMFARIS